MWLHSQWNAYSVTDKNTLLSVTIAKKKTNLLSVDCHIKQQSLKKGLSCLDDETVNP